MTGELAICLRQNSFLGRIVSSFINCEKVVRYTCPEIIKIFMSIWHRFRSIFRWLVSVRSRGFALIYLGLIPTFGVIYWLLPNSFYHSTLQQEQAFEVNRLSIEKRLNEIAEWSWANNRTKHDRAIGDNKETWIIQPLYIENVQIHDYQVEFSTHLLFWSKFGGEDWKGKQYLELKTTFQIDPRESQVKSSSDDVVFPVIELSADMKKLFPDESSTKYEFDSAIFNVPENTIGMMKVPQELQRDMRNYSKGVRGTGSAIEGNFWRMFYLSAMTITTVGFGDIVPLTTASRILISVEAILGIVLIGLFLNALSFESRLDTR